MVHDCENCKYSDIDYIFDEESVEEYTIYTCEKGNDTSLDYECKDFEEYKPKPYKEEFTECDYCQHISTCLNTIESTTKYDKQRHFVKGRKGYCSKESGAFEYKKLSEIIDIAEQTNDPQLKGGKEFLQKAIERFGDIAFKEFMKDKILEMREDLWRKRNEKHY